MRSNAELGKVLYPNAARTSEPARPAPTSRAAAGAVLYGGSQSGQTGSIDNAVRSAFDRIESSARGDAERLRQVQSSREKVRGLLSKANVSPSDAHAMLSVYCQRHGENRSKEALAKHWQGPDGFDRVRREAGSTEAAMKQMAATDAVLEVLKREDPAFAQDLVRTGASQDPRFIQTASRIVDALQPVKQA